MSWWKGEDTWDDCEAFNGLSDAAVALFFRAQARMARTLSDGVLTVADLQRIDMGRPAGARRRTPWRRMMGELSERGLFAADGRLWRDTGWLTRNPSQKETLERRRYDALRQQIRYAKANGNAALEADLRRASDASKDALWALRQARSTATLTSDSRGDSQRPDPYPARPVPKDEVEDKETTGVEPVRLSPVSEDEKRRRAQEAHRLLEDPTTTSDSKRAAQRQLRVLGEVV